MKNRCDRSLYSVLKIDIDHALFHKGLIHFVEKLLWVVGVIKLYMENSGADAGIRIVRR